MPKLANTGSVPIDDGELAHVTVQLMRARAPHARVAKGALASSEASPAHLTEPIYKLSVGNHYLNYVWTPLTLERCGARCVPRGNRVHRRDDVGRSAGLSTSSNATWVPARMPNNTISRPAAGRRRLHAAGSRRRARCCGMGATSVAAATVTRRRTTHHRGASAVASGSHTESPL